jgi:membrane-associated protease RseP (regulator of RpoE activity)
MGDGYANSPLNRTAVVGPPSLSALRACWWRWRSALHFRAPAWMSAFPFHLGLFALTITTTLIVGAQIAANYAARRPAFDLDLSGSLFQSLLHHPSLLLAGLPFSATLLGILLAHELGHYFTARAYGLRVSYPYFIPAPTLIGTLGAFIRIREPIRTRRMLFDVAVAGPFAGFAVAVPALVAALRHAGAGAISSTPDAIIPGHPLALILLAHWIRPGVAVARLALGPAGSAAWVGLFATALNLLPISQLDGGHILYSLLDRGHLVMARVLWLALLPLGYFCWAGWFFWAALIGLIGVKHPHVMIPSEDLGRTRPVVALIALVIFILCFMPTPFSVR